MVGYKNIHLAFTPSMNASSIYLWCCSGKNLKVNAIAKKTTIQPGYLRVPVEWSYSFAWFSVVWFKWSSWWHKKQAGTRELSAHVQSTHAHRAVSARVFAYVGLKRDSSQYCFSNQRFLCARWALVKKKNRCGLLETSLPIPTVMLPISNSYSGAWSLFHPLFFKKNKMSYFKARHEQICGRGSSEIGEE